MYLSFETLLILGIIGFYLYDSAKLLYSNEVIFFKRLGSWRATCISSRWTIIGKSLYLANPITPFEPTFSLYWNLDAKKRKSIDISSLLLGLKPLGFMAFISMVLMVVVIPIIIKYFGTGLYLLIIFALIYLNIIAMIVYICFRRSLFNFEKKQLIAFCFDILACPPFSINVVRKLSLRSDLREDAVEFGLKCLKNEQVNEFLTSIIAKLDQKLECIDDQKEYKKIRKYQIRIEELSA